MFEEQFNALIECDLETYFYSHNLGEIIGVESYSRPAPPGPNDTYLQEGADPFGPDCADLARLHAFITKRKALTVLEFGSGLSTLVMAHALSENYERYSDEINLIRRENPFHIYALEADQKYIEISSEICSQYNERVSVLPSAAVREDFRGMVAGRYHRVPSICPDLIYIDGPSPYSYQELDEEYLSFRSPDITNITTDLLKLEPCLLPGTVVIFDGMTNNARFNYRHLSRNWLRHEDTEMDITVLMLNELPLGIHHRNQLNFIDA